MTPAHQRLERRVSALFEYGLRAERRRVDWHGPATTGGAVWFDALTGRHNGAFGQGERRSGWTFVGHQPGQTAVIRRFAGDA